MPEPLESAALPARVKLGAAVPILRVDDLDISVPYYVERLGFQLQWRSDPLASVGRDRTSIMFPKETRANPAPGCGSQQVTWTNSTMSFMRAARVSATRRRIIHGDRASARSRIRTNTCSGSGRSPSLMSRLATGSMAKVDCGHCSPTVAGAPRNDAAGVSERHRRTW